MKTNLLLLDTHRNMGNLIHSAFALSSQLKRKLKIVYIEDFNWANSTNYIGGTPGYAGADMQMLHNQVREDYEGARNELKRVIADYLQQHPQNIPFEYETSENNRLEYVEQVVKNETDVLLLMSNYNSLSGGEGGVVNYPGILDHIDCPVLILPDNARFVSFNKVVYTSALHYEDIAAIRHFSSLFDDSGLLTIQVFHQSETDDFDEVLRWKGFREMVKEAVPRSKTQFIGSEEKDLGAAIDAFIQQHNPDLIVALKEKKGFFSDLFSTSQTHELIKHFNKPVLIYHEANFVNEPEDA